LDIVLVMGFQQYVWSLACPSDLNPKIRPFLNKQASKAGSEKAPPFYFYGL